MIDEFLSPILGEFLILILGEFLTLILGEFLTLILGEFLTLIIDEFLTLILGEFEFFFAKDDGNLNTITRTHSKFILDGGPNPNSERGSY